ncbi:MAG: hypothetical protein ABF449_09815 [Ethanoligenens sp.]|uniref:hypothetical protein n=1 Tax=Ethanoligenens sp. TaxID=2099655 RepID=UPI0039E90E7D
MKSLRLVSILAVTVSVAALLVSFSGCSKKASASAVSETSSSVGENQRKKMEQRVKEGLSDLVAAGTITQAQADKIQTALTQNLGQRRQNASNKSRPSGSGSHPQWNGSRPDGSGTPSGGRVGRESQLLSSLVSDGTITQAQSDAVIQKLFSFEGGNYQSGSSDADQNSSSQS